MIPFIILSYKEVAIHEINTILQRERIFESLPQLIEMPYGFTHTAYRKWCC